MRIYLILAALLINTNAFSQALKFLNENNLSEDNMSKNYYYDIFNSASFIIEGQYCKDIEILSNVPIQIRRHDKLSCLFGFKVSKLENQSVKMLFFRNIISLDTLKQVYLTFENENDYLPKITVNHQIPNGGCFSIYTDSVLAYISTSSYFNQEINCEILEYDIKAISKGKQIYSKRGIKGPALPKELLNKLNDIESPNGSLIIENVKMKMGDQIVVKKRKTMIGSCFYSKK